MNHVRKYCRLQRNLGLGGGDLGDVPGVPARDLGVPGAPGAATDAVADAAHVKKYQNLN